MRENAVSSPPMTPLHASDTANSSFDGESTDMLRTPEDQSARDLRITRSQLMLSGPQLDDFTRRRTKFSVAQIDELEALFATHGPHPTREQRALTAERINVAPRTVQIFLQNRRQRDSKNKNAAMNAHAAKVRAKQSSVVFPSTNFKFVASKINAVEVMDSTITDSASTPHSGDTRLPKNGAKGTVIKRQLGNPRLFATRNVSLDNIAETAEGTRRLPLVTESKENIPLESGSSPITELTQLPRDTTTPIKRGHLSVFNTPPAAALWTRMISSPPTPLSPINRRRSIQVTASGGKSANLSKALELACAKARASDRPCGEALAGSNPKPSTLPRPPTVSSQKRPREGIEIDAPRKRATVTELHQKPRSDVFTGLDSQYSKTWRVASWRSSCATINAGDRSASEEIATPEDSSMPSSPGALTAEGSSAELVSSPVGHIYLAKPEEGVLGLAELEVNAALVLASLFGDLTGA